MRFLLYKTLKDKRRLGKIAVFNCILYDASRRMANKLLFYSIFIMKVVGIILLAIIFVGHNLEVQSFLLLYEDFTPDYVLKCDQ